MNFPDELSRNLILAPIAKGGNLPFRRLCVSRGAGITFSEMLYARFLIQGKGREKALLRHHETEACFGVQLATNSVDEAERASEIALGAGVKFIDLNCACPVEEATRRGLGAAMLRKPKRIGEIVRAISGRFMVPVTVKLRTGWDDDHINIIEIARILEDSGASALFVHGRTRSQRYTRAADWEIIRETASAVSLPVVGSGDVLTFYEARSRIEKSGAVGVMIGRGALIKPWIFKELVDQKDLAPAPSERIEVYFELARFMKEHFGDDELGRKRIMDFLPWHFSFFHRYRSYPEDLFAEESLAYPLMQRRSEGRTPSDPLESLLQSPEESVHRQIAEEILSSSSVEEAVARLGTRASGICDADREKSDSRSMVSVC